MDYIDKIQFSVGDFLFMIQDAVEYNGNIVIGDHYNILFIHIPSLM
jgi:hypothetical protein